MVCERVPGSDFSQHFNKCCAPINYNSTVLPEVISTLSNNKYIAHIIIVIIMSYAFCYAYVNALLTQFILKHENTIRAIKSSLPITYFNVTFPCFNTFIESIDMWTITSSTMGKRLLLEHGILTWTSSQVSINLAGKGTGTLPSWRRSVCQKEWMKTSDANYYA